MRVVFHVDEEGKWGMALANVRNFLKEVEDAEITVVANGPAVNYYTQKGAIDLDLRQRVDFVACNNAMRGQGIESDQLDDLIRIVSGGVVEIAKKQLEGYAYIRP